jgi:hypothetical protein
VEAHKEHHFFDITEDLAVVVVFSAEQKAPEKKLMPFNQTACFLRQQVRACQWFNQHVNYSIN